MGNTVRGELSTKNKYYINKHRYYELKHFCLQYPEWISAYRNAFWSAPPAMNHIRSETNVHSDPTYAAAELRDRYFKRMAMVEQSAIEADSDLASYILKAVTEELPFHYLKTRLEIPCGKDMYYDRYRRFFWILDQKRD